MAYSNKPLSLDALLKTFMRNVPRKKEMKRGMVLHLWPEVVGEQVAHATRELYFQEDTLIVKVVHTAWRHELTMKRHIIKKKLNSKVGSATVKQIVVRC